VQSYRKGVGVAERYLGDHCGVTLTLRNSFLAAKRIIGCKIKSKSNGSVKTKTARRAKKAAVKGAGKWEHEVFHM